MKRTSLRWLIALATLLVVGILITQVLFLKKVSGFEERLTDQTIKAALIRTKRALGSNSFLTNTSDSTAIKQLSSQYFVVNIEKQIDADLLETQLKRELYRVQITDDFQFAIFDRVKRKLIFGDYIAKNKPVKKAYPVKGLPSYSYNDYYFCVFFPFKNQTVLREMNVWLLFSILLVLSVILFGYAFFVILRQRQLSEIQKDFINNMTHEFQTPIATISISAEALKNTEMMASQDRISNYATIIHEEAKRLTNQVDTILQVAKIDQQYLHLIKKPIDIQEYILAVIKKVLINTKTSPASFRLIGLAEPIYLSVDPIHFSNAIYNLLDNAVKYSVEPIDILITIDNKQESVTIAITDKGIGISKKDVKRIFERFYRIPIQEPKARTGFGIGLHYVRQIIKAHKGTIYVESKLGLGTTFSVNLPK